MKTESRSAFFLLLAAALLWSTGGVLIKLVNLPPLAIVGARSAIAVIALIAIAGWPRPPYSRVLIVTTLSWRGWNEIRSEQESG